MMTDEAAKTNKIRGDEFIKRYFAGKVMDIGCGPDLVVPHAEPFDLEHGDAERILDYRPQASYDSVHSSHCLEHMQDVPFALGQWWELVKSGGFMVLVVPDEDLYEQGQWPSRYNADHKATFRINKNDSWSPVSYDLHALVNQLSEVEIISIVRQDEGYDHTLYRLGVSRMGHRIFKRYYRARCSRLKPFYLKLMRKYGMQEEGVPVDQTRADAVAQIQCVLRKK